jgi:hypothetical protein
LPFNNHPKKSKNKKTRENKTEKKIKSSPNVDGGERGASAASMHGKKKPIFEILNLFQ